VGWYRWVRGSRRKDTPGRRAAGRVTGGRREAATGDEEQGQQPAASAPEDGRAAPASQKG